MKEEYKSIKKEILIYSGELLLIGIVCLVLGILRITKVIAYNDTRRLVFNIITLAGFCWMIVDFVWLLKSPKRRAKNCMLDKILTLPLSLYLFIYDLICLINSENNTEQFYVIGTSIVFFYIFVLYTFQAIYHYYVPHPLLLLADEEDKAKEKSPENTEDSKETK